MPLEIESNTLVEIFYGVNGVSDGFVYKIDTLRDIFERQI